MDKNKELLAEFRRKYEGANTGGAISSRQMDAMIQDISSALNRVRGEVIEKVEKLKLPRKDKDFGWGRVKINGQWFILESDRQAAELLEAVTVEVNNKIDKVQASLTDGKEGREGK